MVQEGAGVAKDEARALALYKRACDRGSASTCSHLGALYRDGTGVPKEPARAAALFKQACDDGDPAGCSSLRGLSGK